MTSSKRAPFDAQAARAKRPIPLWADAFLRDTQELQADEVGAYLLILMAMWRRRSCDLPDDDRRLAQVAKVSTRLWNARIGPVIRPFMLVEDGMIFSKRLKFEAAYVEREVKRQSDKKRSAERDEDKRENSRKALKTNKLASSTDISTDNTADASADDPRNHPRHYPSQQPNNPTYGGREYSSDEESSPPPMAAVDQDFLSEIATACGYQPEAIPGAWLGTKAAELVSGWLIAGLTEDAIIDRARKSREVHPEPPATPQALSGFMAAPQKAQRRNDAPPPSKAEVLQLKARMINSGGYCPPSVVTPVQARDLLAMGLVEPETLKVRGIAF